MAKKSKTSSKKIKKTNGYIFVYKEGKIIQNVDINDVFVTTKQKIK